MNKWNVGDITITRVVEIEVAMNAAIQSLGARAPSGGRRIAALGEMLELGPRSAELHAGLVTALDAAKVDAVWLVGEGMRALGDALPGDRVLGWAKTSAELVDAISADAAVGDVILVKGSNGARMNAVVESLKGLESAERASG